MQQPGQGGSPVKLLMAHDAQVVSVAFDLTELTTQGIDVVLVAEADHPTLQLLLLHNTHPAGDNPHVVKAANLVVGVVPQLGSAEEVRL
ncbi:hypothetical protein D3C75_786560 [compost metagenome]